jgi:cytochrome P450
VRAVSAEERARRSQLPVVEFDIELNTAFRRDPTVAFRGALEIGKIFYSTAARGFWVVSSYELIAEILHQPTSFSSREVFNFYRDYLAFRDIPTQLDAPEHVVIRRLIQPYLALASITGVEPAIRKVAQDLIDGLSSQKGCRFNEDFAERLPAIVIMNQLGLPLEFERQAISWNLTVEYPDSSVDFGYEKHRAAAKALEDMWLDIIKDRRAHPQDDWTSKIVNSTIDGRPLDTNTALGLLLVLLRAGFETTAGTLGLSVLHLATHSEDRQLIAGDPAAIPTAVEEFLRCYGGSPIISRIVSGDIDFHGVPMREGDRLVLLLWSANRDPSAFEEPHRVDLLREPNRHLGFGLGAHRCAGMHLARAELRIALEEWHHCIPEYHLGTDNFQYQLSQDIRLTSLPLVFDRTRQRSLATTEGLT